MTISEVAQDILTDFVDDAGTALVSEAYASRAVERALASVNVALGTSYVAVAGVVGIPSAPALLVDLGARIGVIRHLRGLASGRYSFSSGDKKVDRTKEAASWHEMEKSLSSEYQDLLRQLAPASDALPAISPVVYEGGANA